MHDNEKWEAARRDFEVAGLSYRKLEAKYGIKKSTIASRVKLEGWEKLNSIKVSSDIKQSEILTPLILRKIREIQEELGEKYKSTDEPLVVMFAVDYQLWIDASKKVLEFGTNTTGAKGTEYLSADFEAKTRLGKSLITLSNQLGLSIISRNTQNSNPKEIQTNSLFDASALIAEIETKI